MVDSSPQLCYERDKTSRDWLDSYYTLYDDGVQCADGVRTCSINATCKGGGAGRGYCRGAQPLFFLGGRGTQR